ncbi:hypothetical protein KV205_35410 [Streptomyces sp. SKN60]|uniref:hypothetical protein n=1 Tax=Streptomyces sp. SKN60 TaxID=2855506 RepID=UPI002245C8A9|nr:hypothetical protein [Streptomyces sp. SKN60]MCX2185753.1 hypothetical protein [Streptomyces sp. SKN60]
MANTADGATNTDPGDARLQELCRRLADPAASPELDALGEPGARLVDAIASALRDGRSLQQLGDHLDELEELLLAAGHSAGLGSYRTTPPPTGPVFQRLPVAGPAHPALYFLACPTGRCGRVEAPDDGAPDQPACGLLGRPLNPLPLR